MNALHYLSHCSSSLSMMNFGIIVVGVTITTILMVTSNGLLAIIASGLQALTNSHNSQDVRPIRPAAQPAAPTAPTVPTVHSSSRKFRRKCQSFHECGFDSGHGDILWLACENSVHKVCLCEVHWGLAFSPLQTSLRLHWDPVRGECSMGPAGPCGWNKGLQIDCQTGTKCVNGRCRELGHLGLVPPKAPCVEDSDCEPGHDCDRLVGPKREKDFYLEPKVCLPWGRTRIHSM